MMKGLIADQQTKRGPSCLCLIEDCANRLDPNVSQSTHPLNANQERVLEEAQNTKHYWYH